MLLFKSCPRCWGDLHLDKDRYGVFLTCLQCGYLKDIFAYREEDRPDAMGLPSYHNGRYREGSTMVRT